MNILLTSAGRRSYLVEYFKEALAGRGKVHVANSQFSPALIEADEWVVTPLIYEEGFIEFLLDYVEKHNINILISLFDIDLPVLAKSKALFQELGVEVVISSPSVVAKCNDKWLTSQFLITHGFNTPKTYINLKSSKEAIKSGEINYPLIVKPRWGMGSICLYKAENELELEVFFAKVKREIYNSYLKYESKESSENAVLIQQCINGQEYGLDVFNDLEGNYIKTFVKKKMAMRSGETDGARTEENIPLMQLGERLALSLRHIGVLDMDCFISNGKLYVLEMNCRFGGGYPFTHLAGVNLPKVLLDLSEKKKIKKSLLQMQYNIEMVKDINIIKMSED
ncbi:ATP-grasp domain-containing protein [Salegentibacter sp. HM20]